MLPTLALAEQQELPASVLAYVDRRAADTAAADQGEFMISRVVEVSNAGICSDFGIPERFKPACGSSSGREFRCAAALAVGCGDSARHPTLPGEGGRHPTPNRPEPAIAAGEAGEGWCTIP